MSLKLTLENVDIVKENPRNNVILQDTFSALNCIPNIAVTTNSDKFVNATSLNSQEMAMAIDGFPNKGRDFILYTQKAPRLW